MRLRELDRAAEIIGYDEVVLLGYRDSGMPDTPPNAHPDAFANAPLDDAVGRLVAVIRRERPQVIVTYPRRPEPATRTPTTCGCTTSRCWPSTRPATPTPTPTPASRGSR